MNLMERLGQKCLNGGLALTFVSINNFIFGMVFLSNSQRKGTETC